MKEGTHAVFNVKYSSCYITVLYELPDGVTCPLSNPDPLYALQVVVSDLSRRGSFLNHSFSALSGIFGYNIIYYTYEIHE